MANGFKDTLNRFWNGSNDRGNNAFNQWAYQWLGALGIQYDNKASVYLEKGYKTNPIIFSIVDQMCNKSKAVPYYIKKVKDQKAYGKIKAINTATNGNYNIKQLRDLSDYQTKAYEDIEQDFPLAEPNPNQTWADIIALYVLFFEITGNFYLYKLSPIDGNNAGVPIAVYVLPSHKIEIVLKKGADINGLDNPIDYYKMTEGDQSIRFEVEDVIHIKTANYDINTQGSHLYGMSKMSALLKNLESSNDGLDNNIKTLKNNGTFGVLSAREGNFNEEQAIQIKQKFKDMDEAKGRLSKLTAVSVPVEFTRISLTTQELQPFEYLKYDQQQICNVFGWSNLLLNSDVGMTYNNIKEERKRVVTDNIQPRLELFGDMMTKGFITKFKGYEDSVWEFDITELPEMQADYKEMIEWMNKAYLTPNQILAAFKFETSKIDGMDIPRDPNGNRVDVEVITEAQVNKAWDAYKED